MANPCDAPHYHGGSLSAATKKYPDAPKPWLDLSTGINCVAYPFAAPSRDAYARLPEREGIAALEAAAARCFGLGERAACVAAPGTQALLQTLPRLIPAQKVGVFGFAYAEHARCWALNGAEVFIADTLDDLLAAEVAVIVNPNNPDGRLLGGDALRDLAQRLSTQGKWLIVDEAFVDFLPGASLASMLPLPGVIVLRSFGKVFGLAGLRLGFTLAPEPFARRLRQTLGPWAVSGAAVEIGLQAYGDVDWVRQSAARLAREGETLDAVLREAGCAPVGGTPLFRLVRHDKAPDIFESLCRAGVLVRPFAEKPDWLRFGIPHGDEQFDRLRGALAF
ncbi:threonine-phosphate decarboxylase [Rhodoblastus sphagnicola]|uniref:threonine-phosphate decarboxylase n=1 Tax=Rhodoblastus sphagnicola TaxID=333368 RepID=A0A2S6NB67_9HYPH|nr:threonine-phosphate decarboxylase CobD [Rhodoblastus sphagnicola]MBB4197724.1 cobalamin biosynthetic protein CobC [Rhodoblastus sphagnicola]PPQ31872.1 threonine-phosphate decarboxylase [Rhodoblastus sphagnicola]